MRRNHAPKTRATRSRSIFLAVVLLLFPNAATALDAVLYLDNVTGGNTAPGRVGSMVALAYSFTNQGAFGAATSFSPITVIKPVDQASPLLLSLNASGNTTPTGRLEVFGSNPSTPVFTIQLDRPRVERVAAASGLSGENESVDLTFCEITWIYDTGNGLVQECWDLTTNTSC